jgi:hypothetical protein
VRTSDLLARDAIFEPVPVHAGLLPIVENVLDEG